MYGALTHLYIRSQRSGDSSDYTRRVENSQSNSAVPSTDDIAPIPLQWIGPIRVSGNVFTGEQRVPLATFEAPLWPSVKRGAKLSTLVDGGIRATLVDERMARSVLFTTPDAEAALGVVRYLEASNAALQDVVAQSSRFAKLIDVHTEIVGNLLFVRFEFLTGDASGHNMVTQASEFLMRHLLDRFSDLGYGSISGNFCSDKKATAVNGILGRGKNVVTELTLPGRLVERWLHTTSANIATLNTRKNFVGTTIAGGLRSANAHYANMLLAFFLATGQDAANIVEGSQGITYVEDRGGDLYFSCTLPNLILGTIGNGKGLDFVTRNLEQLGCTTDAAPGANAQKLAVLCAATVLCGELSLLAAQTNPGELMRAHVSIERAGGAV